MNAPAWLRESFRDGVDERQSVFSTNLCWLADHDPLRRPCSGRLERFHFIPRRRVEAAMWEALRGAAIYDLVVEPDLARFREILTLLAAWDPRNGGIGCEGHHRRFDHHLGPELEVPAIELPDHVLDFVAEKGLESEVVKKFGAAEIIGPIDDPTLVL